MLRLLFGFTLPMYGFLFSIILSIVYLMWLQYCQYLNLFVNAKAPGNGKSEANNLLFFLFDIFYFFFIFFFIYFFYILRLYDFRLRMVYINNVIITQLFIFTFFFLFFLFIVHNKITKITKYSIDLLIFIIFIYITNIWLMISNNFLNLFIILEIINLLIIYSFVITIQFNYLEAKFVPIKSYWLVSACTYQFILNFFSSIFFYIIFNLIITYTFSSNFFFLNHFDFSFKNISLYFSLFYLSFLIKFGIGPWIFFKIEIYKNFNYLLVIFYTIIYFTCLLIFFFNLFFIYILPLNIIFMSLLILFFLIILIYFTSFIYSYHNIFVFFSFSSLLNFILILFQWVASVYLFYI